MDGSTYVDTLAKFHTWGSLASPSIASHSNQYAAMPSLHIAWALWCGIAIFCCGLLTVAQMSYMSEYLPKVFPVHLRGTGGGFATNVGARMIGTMAAVLNTGLLAPLFDGPNPVKVATAAAIIGGAAFAVALVLSFLLPPPRTEEPTDPRPIGPDAA